MTFTIGGPHLASVSVDLGEAQAVTLGLLQALDTNDVSVGLGIAGTALCLGKLLSPTAMDNEQSSKFLQDLLEWLGAYFTEGEVN